MDALAFLEKHGRDMAERVAKRAGTNWAYYSQIAHGHRRSSVDLAHRLVAASAAEVSEAGDCLDLVSLLPPKERVA